MSKRFSGQVKISDIQEEFDILVNKINEMIDTYNLATETEEELDLTKGAPTLGNYGYTLTVGGLKKILEIYNNTNFGIRIFEEADNRVLITEGVLITKEGGIKFNINRLPSEGITLDETKDTLIYRSDLDLFDVVNYKTFPMQEGDMRVINVKRSKSDSNMSCLTDFDGGYVDNVKIVTPNVKYSSHNWGLNEIGSKDDEEARFIGVAAGWSEQNTTTASLGGIEVCRTNNAKKHRNKKNFALLSFLYLPKGCKNPELSGAIKFYRKCVFKPIEEEEDD